MLLKRNEKVIIPKHVASAMQRLLLRVRSVYGTERTIVQNFGQHQDSANCSVSVVLLNIRDKWSDSCMLLVLLREMQYAFLE